MIQIIHDCNAIANLQMASVVFFFKLNFIVSVLNGSLVVITSSSVVCCDSFARDAEGGDELLLQEVQSAAAAAADDGVCRLV